MKQAAKGYRVYFISDHHKRPTEALPDNVEVLNWPSARPVHLRDFLFILSLLYQIKPAIVIATFSSVSFLTAVAFIHRVPKRVVFHNSTLLPVGNISIIRFFIRRQILKLHTLSIAVSRQIGEQVETVFKVPESKIAVLQNSVHVPEIESRRDKAKIIVTIASLERIKGVDLLIKAFANVLDQVPGYRLVIIGNGSEYDNLNQLVADNHIDDSVIFTGEIGFSEVQDQLARAAIFVLASRADGGPQAVLEAMVNRCAIIACDVGGISELVERDKTGLLVDSANAVEEISKAIIKLIDDDDLRKSLTDTAFDVVKKEFSSEIWAQKLSDIIDES